VRHDLAREPFNLIEIVLQRHEGEILESGPFQLDSNAWWQPPVATTS